MGGLISLLICKEYPEKVIRAVSIASLYNGDGINFNKGRYNFLTEGGLKYLDRENFIIDIFDKDYKAIDEEDNWLHPRQVLRELEKAMPARAMVSTDIGNINSISNSYLRFEEPRSFFAAMSWGNCGYALPTIIGAKAAAPR